MLCTIAFVYNMSKYINLKCTYLAQQQGVYDRLHSNALLHRRVLHIYATSTM